MTTTEINKNPAEQLANIIADCIMEDSVYDENGNDVIKQLCELYSTYACIRENTLLEINRIRFEKGETQ